MNDERISEVSLRYYGELAKGRTDVIVNAVLVGLFKPIALVWRHRGQRAQCGGRARASKSWSRAARVPRNYTEPDLAQSSHTRDGERWVEGAVFERAITASRARLTASPSRRHSRGR